MYVVLDSVSTAVSPQMTFVAALMGVHGERHMDTAAKHGGN